MSDAAATDPAEQPMLFYQPQVTADGGRFVGLEALLRARRADGSVTGPQDMLAAIATPEEADALDWRILRQACSDARRWPDLSVAINISARQFQHPDFPVRMIALIAEVGVAPTQIELELLEGTIIEDFGRASAAMEALRAHGVRIALDDFGTGYSSLSYLQKLPLDKLKLDKSMVEGVGNLKAAAIVQAVTALSRALGLRSWPRASNPASSSASSGSPAAITCRAICSRPPSASRRSMSFCVSAGRGLSPAEPQPPDHCVSRGPLAPGPTPAGPGCS